MDLPPVPWAMSAFVKRFEWGSITYVTAGEVTTLEHEVRDDTVERRALVAETLLAGAESAEVLGGLGDLVIEEVEVDAALVYRRIDVSFDKKAMVVDA